MQIGVVYPQIEMKADPANVRRFALAAEELGLDYLLAYDHVLGAPHADREPPLTGPYTENDPFHDPFTMFAYLAGLTQRLAFATGILILPQRQTALVAKQAAELDLFSEQRFRMGVGTGWNYVEYDALGVDYAARGKLLDEQVALLRKFWSGDVISFDGAFHKVDRANLTYRPKRQVPIWMGGFAEPAFRRAGAIGDGFMFASGLERSLEQWKRVDHHLNENRRDLTSFGRELIYSSKTADPQRTAETLQRWRDAGGTHGAIATLGKSFTDVGQHIDFIAEARVRLG
jgi:probable F420-dependent oxidoreductase